MTDDIKPPPASEPVHVPTGQPISHAAAQTMTETKSPSPVTSQKIPPKARPGKVNKPPKQSGNGVTSAIVGTVVIILALAGLAVLAYVKTQK
jgi:biotin carboxyl carrier protein